MSFLIIDDGRKISGMDEADVPLTGEEYAEIIQRGGPDEEWKNRKVRTRDFIGQQGPVGKSAYEIASARGFDGSVDEWLLSLQGEDGAPGKSAYEVALDEGFVGDRAAWLASLQGEQGPPGESAYEIAVRVDGFTGTEAEWVASLHGPQGNEGETGDPGLNAYQIALNAGFEGSESEWLESLQGADGKDGRDGVDGRSAYQLAVDQGYTGTLQEWVDSLKPFSGVEDDNALYVRHYDGWVRLIDQYRTLGDQLLVDNGTMV